jgi:LPXTG-site transpeptidase (sortase) family protein
MVGMELSEGRRPSIRVCALVIGAVLLAAVSATACGPPHRVHTGPVPVQLFSWEMGRNLPVYTGITDDVLARGGAGWDPESAALNEPGQVVLFGHRVSRGGPFRTLDQLRLGNVITIVGSDHREYHYRVVAIRITAPSWDAVLAWAPSNGRGLTLVACHPPGSLRYRLVVNAELTT